jgi:hypothetical protein
VVVVVVVDLDHRIQHLNPLQKGLDRLT